MAEPGFNYRHFALSSRSNLSPLNKQINEQARYMWLTPIILATQEA
jgi:hypothetical protein